MLRVCVFVFWVFLCGFFLFVQDLDVVVLFVVEVVELFFFVIEYDGCFGGELFCY